jgi:hypothetical protein
MLVKPTPFTLHGGNNYNCFVDVDVDHQMLFGIAVRWMGNSGLGYSSGVPPHYWLALIGLASEYIVEVK